MSCSTILIRGLAVGLLSVLPATVAVSQVSADPGRAAQAPAAPLGAIPDVVWPFDITTTGGDVSWTSPTSLATDATNYRALFGIELIEVSVEFLGIPFGPFDVSDQIPPDQSSTAANLAGPTPITLINDSIIAPPPPEPIAVAADLLVAIDASGFAVVSATNVTLGTIDVDLGFPLGVVTANITGIRIAGSVAIAPTPWRPLPL